MKLDLNRIGSMITLLCGVVLLSACAQMDPVRGVAGSYRNYTHIKGKIVNEKYFSPANNVTLSVPKLVTPGAVIQDTHQKGKDGVQTGAVSFMDDFGTFYRVDWYEVPRDSLLFDRGVLERIFEHQLATYKQVKAGTVLEAKENLELNASPVLFFSARVPEGSILETNGRRLDASRASLILQRGNWAYSVTTQDKLRLGAKPLTGVERTAALRSDLEKFLEGFEFN